MKVMVAPNGANLTKVDHPALPVTIDETVACAAECFEAGADALHAHVRDDTGAHSLDVGRYRELLSEMRRVVPDMPVQITTELGNRFAPSDQRHLIFSLEPPHVSVALREQLADEDLPAARVTYFGARDQGTNVQHILYSPDEVAQLENLQEHGVIPKGPLNVLFVLGRYSDGVASQPEQIDAFLKAGNHPMSWMVAAFGQSETDCLVHAAKTGGAMRVGFENNRLNHDGAIAASNSARVADLLSTLRGVEGGKMAG